MINFNQTDFLRKALHKSQKEYLQAMLEIYNSEIDSSTDPLFTRMLLKKHITQCEEILETLDEIFSSSEKSASHIAQEVSRPQSPHGVS